MTLVSSTASPQRRGLKPRMPVSMQRCVLNSPSSCLSAPPPRGRRRGAAASRAASPRRCCETARGSCRVPDASSQRSRPEERREASTKRRASSGALLDLHDALGLHPRELGEGGLEGAVGALAARTPVPVELEVSAGRMGPKRRPPPTSCARRRSRTREVRVGLTGHDSNRSGRRSAQGRGRRRRYRRCRSCSRLGSAGLRDRVETLGGTLRVESGRGLGTRLEAAIPLTDDGRIHP